jgi:hypothetical protein
VKNHDFTQKNHIFSHCGGRRENCWGIPCEKSRFHEIPQNLSRLPPLGAIFLSAPPNLTSWIRLCERYIYIYIYVCVLFSLKFASNQTGHFCGN